MRAGDQGGSILDGLGPIAPPARRRLRRVLEAPTQESWNDAFGIVLRAELELTLTLWGAVKAVDEHFPGTKARGPGGWGRVPDQLTLARALRWARATA
jgi:hypothetical protein